MRANHPAIQSAQGGKERRGAVAHIVMSARANVPQAQGQTGLGAFQRLTLAFLIAAEHQRPLGRVQIQADDIPELRRKLRILGQLEGSHPVRFQIVGLPELLHPALGQAGVASHAAHAPTGSSLGRLRHRREHFGHRGGGQRRRSAGTRGILQPRQLLPDKSPPPNAHGVGGGCQFGGNIPVLPLLGRQQNDAGT